MPIVELSVVPVGTQETSVSAYVKAALKIVEESNVDYEVNSMGTCLQGEWDQVLPLIRAIHDELAKMGCGRILTTIKIDDRRDKYQTMSAKVAAVMDEV